MLGPTYPDIVDRLFRNGSISDAERQLRLQNYRYYRDNRSLIVNDSTLKTKWIACLDDTIESAPTLEAVKAKIAHKRNYDCAYIVQPAHLQ